MKTAHLLGSHLVRVLVIVTAGTFSSTIARTAERFLITPTAFDFGEVQVGTKSPPQNVNVTNIGIAPVVVSMAGGAGGAFGGAQNCQGKTLNPGQSCQLTYNFTPTSPGLATGTTGVSVNGQAFAFKFRGTGVAPKFLITPTALDFGGVLLGRTSPPQNVNVTNIGKDPVVVSMAGGAGGAFGGVQNCQGKTLNPGQSCQITYEFTPTSPGLATGTTGGSVNGQAFAFEFRGTGIPERSAPTAQFLITPTGFDFGEVQVGTESPPQNVNVTNIGKAPVVVSMAGGGAGGAFGGFQNCQGKTLNPGDSCQITYEFTPTSPGLATGTTGGSVNGQAFAFEFRGTGVQPQFLITPTGFDFGDVPVGTASPPQNVNVTNIGIAPVVVSMAGGGAGGAFGGFQNCQGKTLNPGDSCQITYDFTPTSLGLATGTTGGSVNGQAFAFEFRGTGVLSQCATGSCGLQVPGDCNQDGKVDLSDAVCLLGYLFQGTPSLLPCGNGAAADPSNRALLSWNGDGAIDLSDAIGVLSWLFQGGRPHVLGGACQPIAGCGTRCN